MNRDVSLFFILFRFHWETEIERKYYASIAITTCVLKIYKCCGCVCAVWHSYRYAAHGMGICNTQFGYYFL